MSKIVCIVHVTIHFTLAMPLILSLQTFHNKSPVQTEGFCPLKHYIIRIRRALKELRGYSRNLDHLWRNLSLSHSLPYLALLSNLNFPACLLSRTLSISVQLPPCISFCISSVISLLVGSLFVSVLVFIQQSIDEPHKSLKCQKTFRFG